MPAMDTADLRRVALLLVLFLLGSGATLGIVYWGWFSNDIDAVLWVLLLPLGAMWAFFPDLSQTTSEGRLLVHCRRFGRTPTRESRSTWFEQALLDACHSKMVAVTLQDDVIPSHYVRRMRTGVFLDFARISVAMGAPMVVLILLEPWHSQVPMLVVFPVIVMVMLSALAIMTVVKGFVRTATGSSSPASVYRQICRISRSRRTPDHLIVLRSRDEDWRENVERLLDMADVLVVDSTQMTDNIRWEIERARERLGNDNVLFVRWALRDSRLECSPGQVDEKSATIMKLPDRSGDPSNIESECVRFAAAKCLRAWLEARETTGRDLAASYAESYRTVAESAKQRARWCFVFIAMLTTLGCLLPLSNDVGAPCAQRSALLPQRQVSRPTWSRDEYSVTTGIAGGVFTTMRAGAAIGSMGVLAIYIPVAIMVGIFSVVSDPDGWAVAWFLGIVLVPGWPGLMLHGAVQGAFVHMLVFRRTYLRQMRS